MRIASAHRMPLSLAHRLGARTPEAIKTVRRFSRSLLAPGSGGANYRRHGLEKVCPADSGRDSGDSRHRAHRLRTAPRSGLLRTGPALLRAGPAAGAGLSPLSGLPLLFAGPALLRKPVCPALLSGLSIWIYDAVRISVPVS